MPGIGLSIYTIFADVLADGRINAADLGTARARLNKFLPSRHPTVRRRGRRAAGTVRRGGHRGAELAPRAARVRRSPEADQCRVRMCTITFGDVYLESHDKHALPHSSGAARKPRWSERALFVEGLESRTLLSTPPVGPEFQVNTTALGNQTLRTNQRSVAMNAAGDFVVLWESDWAAPAPGPLLYAQRFNAAGVKQGGELPVTPILHRGQSAASVAMDATGNFVVAWDNQGIAPQGIYVQRFGADAAKQGGPQFMSALGDDPSIAMDADGDYIVAWAESNITRDVFALRFDALGNLKGNMIVANFHVEVENEPAVAASPDGGFVISCARLARRRPGV